MQLLVENVVCYFNRAVTKVNKSFLLDIEVNVVDVSLGMISIDFIVNCDFIISVIGIMIDPELEINLTLI